jgi:hypothetical protein
VLDNFLSKKDLLIGAELWEIKLAAWLEQKYTVVRKINSTFHKYHTQEWRPFEIESIWNKSQISVSEIIKSYSINLVESMSNTGRLDLIPKYIRFALKIKHPILYKILVDVK